MTLVFNATGTANNNHFDPTDPGIEYGADLVQVTIAAGVFISSGGDHGVLSTQDGSTLINNGNILANNGNLFGNSNGVTFSGDFGLITNNAGRSIAGGDRGILLTGDGAGVSNFGTIIGYQRSGIETDTTSDNFVLTNNNGGVIYGPGWGVFLGSDVDGGTINNSGLIHSDNEGIAVATNSGLTTVINNFAGGTIKGPDAAISVSLGRISLDNDGTISGDIDCNAITGNVNDVVVNSGKITGQVFLGAGNDTFNGTGGTSGNVFGEGGDDTLIGGDSADNLHGGANDDILRGGLGRDFLTWRLRARFLRFQLDRASRRG